MRPIIKYKNILAIKLVALLISFGACNHVAQKKTTGSESNTKKGNKVQTVEVVNPKPRTFTVEVLITGTARPNQKVMLYSMESGYVKNIRKDIGDRVRKGETIAVLDNPELYSQREKLKVQLQAKQSTYVRLKSIQEKTPALTPIQLVEDAEAEYLAVQAEWNAINDRINFLKVQAPFSGVITQRFVDNGALLQSGLSQTDPQAIAELQQTDPIRLTIFLPESDVSAIKAGMEVSVTFPELPGESFFVQVSRMAKALDPTSKTMQVEIDIDNPDDRIITGMYAKCLIQIKSREDVPSLPLIAKTMYQDEPHVLVVKEGKVNRIPLRTGLSGKDYFEVLNPEIKEETLVIIKGKNLVKPGQIVEPILKQE